MTVKLTPRQVAKPWGRKDLPAPFRNSTNEPIGEIWFEDGRAGTLPFLTKYIFTSERLSVQVHPSDAQAAAKGHPRGKTECWYIMDCEPGAEIGLGLTRQLDSDKLRSAALDGSILDLLAWRKVRPGNFFYVPAGTVHAIGADVSLLEFQQNSDITYRLFDYGRPRELHLDDAVDVAISAPYDPSHARFGVDDGRILHSGDDFTFLKARQDADVPASLADRHRWVMPIEGTVAAGGIHAVAGECLLVEPGDRIHFGDNVTAMVAAGGPL